MDAPWHIQLLGALRAETGGRAVTRFRTRQVGALLARLALFPDRAHAREELVDLLWPAADLPAGRNRLRVALASLRRQLEPPGVAAGSVLIADRTHVRLNPAAVRCDAVEFERLARAGRSADARALYAGELLPGFYDDWVQDERARLDALYEDLCGRETTETSSRPAAAPSPAVLNTPSPRLHGVPLPLSRFFGREDEQIRLAELLADPDTRLVTLSGPGGAGKTRLAVEAARAATGGLVFWVGLADLDDARLIPAVLAAVMGLAPAPAREPLDVVADALREVGPALLVLDNLEHLAEWGAPLVQSLLTRVPTLTLLVTSRRRLAVPGEREMALGPLSLPPADGTAEQVAASDSARLFVDRAQAARPDFQVTARNAGDLAALCQDLEGLPLALELAAARAGALGVGEMRQKLAQRFAWLASRRTDKNARHRSLWAALAWSFDLLPPASQRFFAQLSVFRGGCTVEAAQAVCREPQALEFLTQLRERSLALVEDGAGGVRFRLLESVREFGAEQLTPEEREELGVRHRAFFLALAERAAPHLAEAEAPAWLTDLGAERDNLRAAMEACLGDPAPDAAREGLRLAGALARFWQARGEMTEGRDRLAAVLARPGADEPSAAHALAWRWAGVLAFYQGDYAAAEAGAAASLVICDALGAASGGGWARMGLGNIAACRGDYAGARPYQEEALALFRKAGDVRGITAVLNNLAGTYMGQGELAGAEPLYEEALAIQRAAENWPYSVVMLTNLGTLAFYRGDLPAARLRLEESLALRTEAGIRSDQPGYTLAMLGWVALGQGRPAEARTHLVEGLTACRAGGDRASATNLLDVWGRLQLVEGRPDHTARALGATSRLRFESGVAQEPVTRPYHEDDVAAAQAALGSAAFAAAWAAGEALSWEQAIDEALAGVG